MSGRRLAGMIIINSLLQVNFVLYKDLLIFSWKFQFFLDKFHITAEITFQIIQFRTPSFHSRSSWTLCFTWNWHSGETCSLSSVFSSCSSYCYPSALLSLSQGQCSIGCTPKIIFSLFFGYDVLHTKLWCGRINLGLEKPSWFSTIELKFIIWVSLGSFFSA